MNEFYCEECEAEFQIIHDSISEPEFCPFCAAKMHYDDENLDDLEYDEE